MSVIYVVWAKDADRAQARMEHITNGTEHRVLRRGCFAFIQAEDIDEPNHLDSDGERYGIVFEVY